MESKLYAIKTEQGKYLGADRSLIELVDDLNEAYMTESKWIAEALANEVADNFCVNCKVKTIKLKEVDQNEQRN